MSGDESPRGADDLVGDCFTGDITRAEARARLAARFRRAGLRSDDLDARLLVSAACGIDQLGLVCDPHVQLGKVELAVLAAYAGRRLGREPVARILGAREFWGLSLALSPHVLDPRPDTECLVAAVLDACRGAGAPSPRLLDLGTGSGAILAALLHELPDAFGVAVDRSPDACRVASANLIALGFKGRAAVVCGSWTDPIAGAFEAIVSNPPYIASRDIQGLEADVRQYEPRAALDGGADGLDAYRAFLPGLAERLVPGGVAAVECGWDQADAVAAMFADVELGGVSIHLDLAGHKRVVRGKRL